MIWAKKSHNHYLPKKRNHYTPCSSRHRRNNICHMRGKKDPDNLANNTKPLI